MESKNDHFLIFFMDFGFHFEPTSSSPHSQQVVLLIGYVIGASGFKMVTLRLDDETDVDQYDIKESFEALDTQKTGRLDFELAYSLLLGLGYMSDYKKKDDFNVSTLEQAAKRIENAQNENYDGVQSGIDLDTLLAVVDAVRALFLFLE